MQQKRVSSQDETVNLTEDQWFCKFAQPILFYKQVCC